MGTTSNECRVLLSIEESICIARSTVVCNSGYRCHICQTFASSLNNYMVKSRNLASRHGRPLEPALGFVRPKQVLDETVGKTWLKLVKIGQNWTKPNNFRIC